MMEPCWVYTMERSEHFRRAGFTVATVALIVVDLAMLSVAMQDIGAGVAYAVWAGIGAIVTLVMGVLVGMLLGTLGAVVVMVVHG